MPYVLQAARSYAFHSFRNALGNTECVEFIRQTLNAPETKKWREGSRIVRLADGQSDPVPEGTAIATFVDSRYPQAPCPPHEACKHAAIYLGQDEHGIIVADQWRAQGQVKIRTIPWHPHQSGRSNDGNAFSVIE